MIKSSRPLAAALGPQLRDAPFPSSQRKMKVGEALPSLGPSPSPSQHLPALRTSLDTHPLPRASHRQKSLFVSARDSCCSQPATPRRRDAAIHGAHLCAWPCGAPCRRDRLERGNPEAQRRSSAPGSGGGGFEHNGSARRPTRRLCPPRNPSQFVLMSTRRQTVARRNRENSISRCLHSFFWRPSNVLADPSSKIARANYWRNYRPSTSFSELFPSFSIFVIRLLKILWQCPRYLR